MKTIEEIKEIIARKVAGQGNQIDLGGGVNEALNEILDIIAGIPIAENALIIEGEAGALDIFTPSSGQPTAQYVKEKFLKGVPCFISFVYGENDTKIIMPIVESFDDGPRGVYLFASGFFEQDASKVLFLKWPL